MKKFYIGNTPFGNEPLEDTQILLECVIADLMLFGWDGYKESWMVNTVGRIIDTCNPKLAKVLLYGLYESNWVTRYSVAYSMVTRTRNNEKLTEELITEIVKNYVTGKWGGKNVGKQH